MYLYRSEYKQWKSGYFCLIFNIFLYVGDTQTVILTIDNSDYLKI